MWSGFSFNRSFRYSKRWFRKQWVIIFQDSDQWNTNDGYGEERHRSRKIHVVYSEAEAIKFVELATLIDERDKPRSIKELISLIENEEENQKTRVQKCSNLEGVTFGTEVLVY